ncbi:MAG: EVE domain-containing protein [Heteroscytonema crispum UTEX LB 1556]
MENSRYWVVVASREHVHHGVEGGFMQACHGKASPLKRLKVNDWVIYYSPKLEFGGKEKCQAFTAIGRVIGESFYPYDMGNGFILFRRKVQFFEYREVSILPLILNLDFIKNKNYWGYVFRFGFLEISKLDFNVVASLMLPNLVNSQQ